MTTLTLLRSLKYPRKRETWNLLASILGLLQTSFVHADVSVYTTVRGQVKVESRWIWEINEDTFQSSTKCWLTSFNKYRNSTASSTSNLYTASVSVAAIESSEPYPGAFAGAQAALSETLYFTNSKGSPDSTVHIPFSVQWESNGVHGPQYSFDVRHTGSAESILEFRSELGFNPDDIHVGLINLTGVTGSVSVSMSAMNEFGKLDALRSGRLSFDFGELPEGVSFSSESGCFLDGAPFSPIGGITEGVGTATRNGVTSVIEAGEPIASGDRIKTEAGQEIQIDFNDQSSLHIGENGDFVIDEYVYDPNSSDERGNFSVLRGLISFVSGLMPKSKVKFDTPWLTLGIRGTEFSLEVAESGDLPTIDLAVESGIVDMTNPLTGATHVVSAGESLSLTGPPPSLDTIRLNVLQGANPVLSLNGYTDTTFTVQRSIDLVSWDDWLTFEPSDLPMNLEVIDDPAEATRFFRLKRISPEP